MRFGRTGNHQQSAGVLVQPMDEAGTRQCGQRRIHSQQGILQAYVVGCRRRDAPPIPPACPPPAHRDPRAPHGVQSPRATPRFAAPRRSRARGRGHPHAPRPGACREGLPTCTWPASIQPLMRVRECSGSKRASAPSRRCPANSCGISRSMTWNSALMRALEASGGASGILPRT